MGLVVMAAGGGPSRKSSVVADDPKNRNASSMDWINSGLEAARSQSIDAGSDKEESNKGGKGGVGGFMANLKSTVMGEKGTNSGGTDGIVVEGSNKSLTGGGGEGGEAEGRTRDEGGDSMDEDDQITPSKFKSRLFVPPPRPAPPLQSFSSSSSCVLCLLSFFSFWSLSLSLLHLSSNIDDETAVNIAQERKTTPPLKISTHHPSAPCALCP